eukprot:gene1487-1575_t
MSAFTFSDKRKKPANPLVSPRRVIAPKQFSNLIQQTHNVQIDRLETAQSILSSPSPTRKIQTRPTSVPTRSNPTHSSVAKRLETPTVATMDILYPQQRQIVAQLAKPKQSPKSLLLEKTKPKRKSLTIQTDLQSQASSSSSINQSINTSSSSLSTTRQRHSVQQLENELIEQTKILQKLQVEFEQSQKIYSKTKEQLELKQQENSQTAKDLMNQLTEVRKSLSNITSI